MTNDRRLADRTASLESRIAALEAELAAFKAEFPSATMTGMERVDVRKLAGQEGV